MRRRTPHAIQVELAQKRLLARLAGLDHAAIVRALSPFLTPERKARFDAVFASRLGNVTVLMDAPYDPHNGAAVLRSCDAFGVQRLHVVERGGISFLAAREVARGSEQWVHVRTYPTGRAALDVLAASGHELVATHPQGELMPEDLRSIPKVCLVLGNERDGIHEELVAACKRSVRVPMRGFVESLNVSVTGAILLQHATSGRQGDLPEEELRALHARAMILTIDHAAEVLLANGISLGEDALGVEGAEG
ncbi:TrmH family RNA methyltransferase [Polyangium sorediatum]|uniref:RNA methyltransferase n=1 Tax=Polyangium sorediatum TaxID=889274 RepID=A0ABT6NUF8_9BACT|nr:RNA methyltransferase [Polyangium sorediatum]MDI1431984.1 RNA methyltransferase [Polyangium sorediatum]